MNARVEFLYIFGARNSLAANRQAWVPSHAAVLQARRDYALAVGVKLESVWSEQAKAPSGPISRACAGAPPS